MPSQRVTATGGQGGSAALRCRFGHGITPLAMSSRVRLAGCYRDGPCCANCRAWEIEFREHAAAREDGGIAQCRRLRLSSCGAQRGGFHGRGMVDARHHRSDGPAPRSVFGQGPTLPLATVGSSAWTYGSSVGEPDMDDPTRRHPGPRGFLSRSAWSLCHPLICRTGEMKFP